MARREVSATACLPFTGFWDRWKGGRAGWRCSLASRLPGSPLTLHDLAADGAGGVLGGVHLQRRSASKQDRHCGCYSSSCLHTVVKRRLTAIT